MISYNHASLIFKKYLPVGDSVGNAVVGVALGDAEKREERKIRKEKQRWL